MVDRALLIELFGPGQCGPEWNLHVCRRHGFFRRFLNQIEGRELIRQSKIPSSVQVKMIEMLMDR